MTVVTYQVPCGCGCKAVTAVEVNLINGEHRVLRPKGESTYGEKWQIVLHYKALKGYDKLPTWDRLHKARAMKGAKQILAFFACLPDPVGVAKECMDDTAKRAQAGGWPWTLETILKVGPDWLIDKQKKIGGRR